MPSDFCLKHQIPHKNVVLVLDPSSCWPITWIKDWLIAPRSDPPIPHLPPSCWNPGSRRRPSIQASSDQLLIHVFFTRGSGLESSKQYLRINVEGQFALLVSWSNSLSSLSVRWARETTMKIIWKTKLKSYVQSPTKIVLQTTPKVYKSTLCRIRAYVVQLAKEGRYSSNFDCIYLLLIFIQ